MPYIGAGVQRFNTADNLTVTGTSELKNDVTVTGDVTASGTVLPTGDTAAGDAAALGFTSAEGLILTGQGSTNDITIKNDADADVLEIPTGTTNVTIVGNLGVGGTVTGTGTSVFASLDISGDIDVDGTTNLDVVDIDGAVDMASTLQVDGAITSSSSATITTTGNEVQLTLKSTDADGSLGPKLDLTRDSSSPADGDNCGQINFKIDNDAGESTQYGDIFVGAIDVSDGTEDAHMTFSTMKGGSRNSRMKLHSDETVFNEDSVDVDFRVESNGAANMLFVDGGNDAVGINTNSPHTTSKLHVFESARNGGYAINTSYDAFIVEGETHVGLSICGGSNNSGSAAIAFPNGSSSIDGLINYEHAARSLQFYSAQNERARFLSSGNFLLGKTAENIGTAGVEFGASGYLQATRDGSTALYLNRLSNTGTIALFQQASNTKGSIDVDASGTTYSTTSDRRLKQDIEPLEATDKLMAMNPVSYAWKADPDGPRSMGFIAQEMQEIMPDAVSTGDDDDAMMSMDYGRITPILVSALQDAHRKIEKLETRLAALES